MQFKSLITLACATLASAQSLTDVLRSQNATLSTLTGLLAGQPQLLASLGSAQNITVLAPSNQALQKLLSDNATAAALAANPSLLTAVLTYHVLNGTRYASSFPASSFVPTILTNSSYTNVTGGQRVQALSQNGRISFISGLKTTSAVIGSANFTGGAVHIIDTVLSLPGGLNATLAANNLTALSGALTATSQLGPVSTLRDLTIFAPSNAAFAAISNVTATLSVTQLSSILGYHVVNGTVAYSTLLSNTTVRSLTGQNITITVSNGNVFVNSAKVTVPDVLYANGVVHVIDSVLSPASTAGPYPSATTTSTPAAGTSGVSRAAAVPMQTAAVGAAALFAGAGILVNM